MIKKIISKYKAIILYLIFGGLTTIINIASYYVCMNYFDMGNVPSNIVAWLLAVIGAYITNKLWVFESETESFRQLFQEVINFVSCRIATGAIDLLIMYIGVDVMQQNNLLIKVIANVFVIISNYVASKLWIFKS